MVEISSSGSGEGLTGAHALRGARRRLLDRPRGRRPATTLDENAVACEPSFDRGAQTTQRAAGFFLEGPDA